MALVNCFLTEEIEYRSASGTNEYGQVIPGEKRIISGRKSIKDRYVSDNTGYKRISEITFVTKDKVEAGDYLSGMLVSNVEYCKEIGVYVSRV